MGLILWLLPIILILAFAASDNKNLLHAESICASFIMMLTAGILTKEVMTYGSVQYLSFGGIFYIDSLSIIILDITLIIGFITSIYSIDYLNQKLLHLEINLKRLKLYYILMYSFILTMILALTVKNMGIMWIAIEATTLASVFLVGFYNDKQAIEAAWKYIIICSLGIVIALLGIMFLHLSSVEAFKGSHLLEWPALFDNAKTLKTSALRLAFIFILVGFGTKAGLAPMHTWLPDAHSQAPSPISALLSGVLLNSSIYAITRAVSIVNKNLGNSDFTGRLLIATGLLSIITSAIFILTQKDYKRLLAYSSIEHMGIIALGIGIFTPGAVFGALFHMINHSFTKSMLFLSSGNILQKYGTREISKIKGLLKILPASGIAFLLGLFAISGAPPFSIFSSELSIIISIFEKKFYLAGTALVLLLAAIFAGIALTLFNIFYRDDIKTDLEPGEVNIPGTVAILAMLILISVSGLYMPNELKELLFSAQQIITGG